MSLNPCESQRGQYHCTTEDRPVNGRFARHQRRALLSKETLLSITQFTFEQAVDVWMHHFSGQYQHQIAAAYIINVRAVNHVLKEKTHVGSKRVAEARFNKSA